MYKRLRDGLFDPKAVVDYIKDKGIIVALFVVLFAFVMAIPSIFRVANYSLDYKVKSNFVSEFKNEEIPFEIVNGSLKCTDSTRSTNYQKKVGLVNYIIFNNEEVKLNTDINVIFETDNVFLRVSGIDLELLKYSEYEDIKNLSFSTLSTGNDAEWDKVFNTVNKLYKDNLSKILVYNTIAAIISGVVSLMAVALIFSLSAMFRLNKVVKFSAVLKLNIYYLAPFAFASLLDEIFGIGFIYIIGIIVTIVYTNIGQIEIFKRVYGHHTEG